jgi:hypothetical protein
MLQVNVVAQKKRKKHSEYNWNESGTSNHFRFDRERIKCWKDFFKEEYNLEMIFRNYNRQKQRTNCHKVELKDKEESKSESNWGESPIKPFTVFAEKTLRIN